MILEVQVTIAGSNSAIWAVISDIENAADNISGIESVEILDKPKEGFIGLKWREARTLFGKTATETMWITDAAENEFYKAQAESHGSIYISTLSIAQQETGCTLSMSHESIPQSLVAKIVGVPMCYLFKGLLKKTILKDLEDIKAIVEQG